MAVVGRVKGVANVINNLNKANDGIRKRVSVALMKGGLMIQRESQKIVPVETGNLKASAYTRKEMVEGTDIPAVRVGYTTIYAIYVHENLEAAHGSWFNFKYAYQIANYKGKTWFNRGENQQAKFLERPFRELRSEIMALVKMEASRK